MLFQLGKILCFKPRVWKVKRAGKLLRTSNAPEGEARLVTKRVGSAFSQYVCGTFFYNDTFNALVDV